EPVVARPPSTAYRMQKMVRRNKVAFSAAAVVALTLILSASYSGVQAVKARRSAAAAKAAEKLATTSLSTAEQERDRAKRYAGQLDQANDALKSSLTRFQFKWGVNHLDNNEYSKGVAFLAKALRTDPTSWPAATRLISVLTDRGFPLDVLPPIIHDQTVQEGAGSIATTSTNTTISGGQPIYDSVLNNATGLLVTRG